MAWLGSGAPRTHGGFCTGFRRATPRALRPWIATGLGNRPPVIQASEGTAPAPSLLFALGSWRLAAYTPGMRLFDTLTRTERELRPLDGATYRFYCCGPTVYGPAHIGNFRTFVLQDVLRRTLETGGTRTLHVRNITDVDDKTIRDSQKAGQSLAAFTAGWTAKFHADCDKLGLLAAAHRAGSRRSHPATNRHDRGVGGKRPRLRLRRRLGLFQNRLVSRLRQALAARPTRTGSGKNPELPRQCRRIRKGQCFRLCAVESPPPGGRG